MRESKIKASGERRSRNYNSRLVARDKYYYDLEHEIVRDKSIFDAGMQWFNNGFSLDDASDEMKNKLSFVEGFKKAKRLDSINKQLFELGREWYLNGRNIDDAPENYKNNEYFCNGYGSGEIDLGTKKR